MGKYTTGKYVVPPEIRDLKPQNVSCTVKKIKGHYYVYSLKEVPNTKHLEKPKYVSDKIIGKIEGGCFIPNEKNKQLSMFDITTRDYGEYAIALQCSLDILNQLKSVFSDFEAKQIYVLSVIYFVEGYIPASYVKDLFDQSVLSIKWPTLALSENSVHKLLKQLGLHNLLTEKFQQSLVDTSSGLTALDGHVILSCSNESDLADYGNKYQKYGSKQLNIMMAYDVEFNNPLTCRAFDGAVPDKAEVQDWFETYHFKPGTTFIVDMGFYSEDNLGLYRSNNSFFVIPVSDNTVISKMMRMSITFTGSFQYFKNDETGKNVSEPISYRESTVSELEVLAQKLEDKKAEDDYQKRLEEYNQDPEKGKKRKPRIHKAKQITHSRYPDDRVIMYRNETMHKKLAHEYLSQVGLDDKHTEEKYKELEPTFGLIILRLNSKDTAEAEYTKYKKRWRIETNYNHVRNDVDFNDLQLEDYYTIQGLSFLILIEDMIYRRFMKKMRSASSVRVSHMSKKECLHKAGHAKVIFHNDGKWHGSIVTSSVTSMLKEMGVSWEGDLDKLNKNVY